MIGGRARRRETRPAGRSRTARPALEALEDRLLLYAATGTQWANPIRITYSFVPDGTSIGGVPSNLQAAFNARFGAGLWQEELAEAAAAWQKVAKINFAPVADTGAPIGVAGNQQGDARFGDIRIGGFVQDVTQLAFAYLPPPYNGGTNAGDIFFNTGQLWQINGTTYDLRTVALHEFGHALGLSHSTSSAAALWPAYIGTKQALTADDIGGIRQIYNARQNDYFDANGSNNTASTADNISSYLNASGQLTLSALDTTTPLTIGSGDNDWLKVTVPPTTSGTLVVKMQSQHLSLLSPHLAVYNASGTTRLAVQSSLAKGDTVSVTISGVTPGQVYTILAKGATVGTSGYGAYALQVNFGSEPLPAVAVPNTTVAQAADQGTGTLSQGSGGAEGGTTGEISQVGDPGHFWVYDEWDAEAVPEAVSTTLDTSATDPSHASASIRVGHLVGRGDALTIAGHSHHDEAHEESGHVIDLTPRGGTRSGPDRRVAPDGLVAPAATADQFLTTSRRRDFAFRRPDALQSWQDTGGGKPLQTLATRPRPRTRPAQRALDRIRNGWSPGGG